MEQNNLSNDGSAGQQGGRGRSVFEITGVRYNPQSQTQYSDVKDVIVDLKFLRAFIDNRLDYSKLVHLSEEALRLSTSSHECEKIFQTQSQEIKSSYRVYQNHIHKSPSKKRKKDEEEDLNNFEICRIQLLKDLGEF